jgi:hypothetical protein
MTADHSHLMALINRLGNERRYLSVAKTEGERALRTVWISQIEREISDEERFLGMAPATGEKLSNADLLAELMA